MWKGHPHAAEALGPNRGVEAHQLPGDGVDPFATVLFLLCFCVCCVFALVASLRLLRLCLQRLCLLRLCRVGWMLLSAVVS